MASEATVALARLVLPPAVALLDEVQVIVTARPLSRYLGLLDRLAWKKAEVAQIGAE